MWGQLTFHFRYEKFVLIELKKKIQYVVFKFPRIKLKVNTTPYAEYKT